MIRVGLTTLALIALTTPALAQDHSAHQAEPDPHAGHDMSAPQTADPHAGHIMPDEEQPTAEPEAMDGMDHSMMDHDADANAPSSPGPEMETPPPSEAGSGPPRAADAIWGADAMRASRLDLQQTHGDYNLLWFQADRAELQMRDGADGYLWDLQGYYGGTTSRFWFKSEGEGSFGQRIEDLEIQGLYSRAIAPFFDLQAGIRQDFGGADTTYAVVGIQGLVPYMFEVDGAVFLSHRGDITARLEAELDQRITQRLIVQPRAELNLAAQDIPQLGIGSGIDSFEIGVRLRYEIIREIAPYIGIEQNWRVGGSADFARAAGEDASVTNYVVGIRFWF
ncbi:copper resistance B family protein (plasmid) [Blastomonas sp. RAC04]|uniref:copper resistance protein B n=1 Tax=Blastomonas sp. RAC04 TaxID=1842535 RepID=UPI00083CF631|nr:copper resistance protein B [Blastomonas sp. RAC04]AOF98730.1 copper resistance B family protein [Blastomonas sp. RAC04]